MPQNPIAADGTPDETFELSADAVAERVGSGYVLVHLETNRIYELEGTGARIFELMRQGANRGAIERVLAAEYDATGEQLAADLEQLIARLRAAQLLR